MDSVLFMNMKCLLSRLSLFELANIKSRLVVEVIVRTKPSNELINAAILGVMSSSIGGMTNLSRANQTKSCTVKTSDQDLNKNMS